MTFGSSASCLNDLCFENAGALVPFLNDLITNSKLSNLYFVVMPQNASEWSYEESYSNILDSYAILIEENPND